MSWLSQLTDSLFELIFSFIKSYRQKNAIAVISPFKKNGIWVFTDHTAGLVEEPFVAGIPEIIESLIKDKNIPMDKAELGINIMFSAHEFPGWDIQLEKESVFNGGVWYKQQGKAHLRGWLCPALFRYYTDAPEKIFVKLV